MIYLYWAVNHPSSVWKIIPRNGTVFLFTDPVIFFKKKSPEFFKNVASSENSKFVCVPPQIHFSFQGTQLSGRTQAGFYQDSYTGLLGRAVCFQAGIPSTFCPSPGRIPVWKPLFSAHARRNPRIANRKYSAMPIVTTMANATE